MYIDAHCHLDYPSLSDDITGTLKNAAQKGVTGFLVGGVNSEGWARQRRLARQYASIAWTAGLHPAVHATMPRSDLELAMQRLATCFDGEGSACGVGEMGLDRVFAPKSTLEWQAEIFKRQLGFARALDQPCVFHIVGAHGRALQIMQREGLPEAGGMVHSFSGSREMALEYLRLGLHISITARQLARMTVKIASIVEAVPPDRLMLESDAPDQCPQGSSVNTPDSIVAAGVRVAEIRKRCVNDVLSESSMNCYRLFKHVGWLPAAR